MRQRDDGRYDVTMTVQAAKFEADENGAETEVPLDMTIDIGAFNDDLENVYEGEDHVLLFEKRRIKSGKSTVTFVVDEPPKTVGIDPYNKMVDRVSSDNVRRVSAPASS